MLKRLVLFCLLGSGLLLHAQEKADSAKKPRAMTWKDVSSWRSFSPYSVSLSPDGKWVAYPMTMREGDGELIVQKVNDTIQKKYPIGASYAGMSFSEDGKWLAFKESAKFKERKAAAKSPGKQLFDKLILLELATGKKTEFEKAASFSFNGRLSSYLAISIAKERTPGAKPDDAKGSDLLLIELGSSKSQNIGNVGEFSFNKEGNIMAYTIDASNKSGNGLYLLNLANKQTTVLDNDKAVYRSLGWTDEGDALALLKMTKDEKYKTDKGAVLGVKNPSATPAVTIYDPATDSLRFPKGMTISANRRPYWSEDLSRLFFGIAELEPVKKENADTTKKAKETASAQTDTDKLDKLKSDTSIKSLSDLKKALAKLEARPDAKPATAPGDEPTKPDMIIWNWQDKRLQSRQQVTEMQDRNFTYLGTYNLSTSTFSQLNDSTVRSVSIFPRQLFAVGTDNRGYELDQNLDGQNYVDIYIIDLKTGLKTLFAEKFYLPSYAASPRPSPDGTKFLYGKDGHYYVYDLLTKTDQNITANVPTSFVDTEDDHNVTKPLAGVIGWSSDNKYVLLQDLWDIWQVPVSAGKETAVNLTMNGGSDKIRYQTRYILDRDEKGIDVKKPMYIRAYGEWTKKSGIARIEPAKKGWQAGARMLVWDDIAVNALSKAKNAETYMFSKETFNTATEFYAGGPMLSDAKKVTENTPDKGKYTWSAGTQLVNYVSDKGDSLQGALFLPAGYEKGKKYPTIVYYYEKMSQTLNSYSNPDFPGGGWNPAMYTSNGYAVFMPDIVYKLDDPGMSAVWCVLPAVKAAIATGVIDEKNIGIQGHSWGGYQTAFLSTQTNMFKAAAPGAALTNMVSMYDLIYWNSGGGNMSIFEASQGRFRGAPWENWDSYLRNSPIYYVKQVTTPILLLHNDKDGAVDFTQGIEFYNALRRLKKPIVMITYKGENHGISKLENRKDYAVRMMEFFDYHLKGKPAPDWWEQGINREDMKEHLEKRAF